MKKIYIHFSIFVLFLAIILAFSGCGRKNAPVVENNLTPALSSEEREQAPLPPLQKGEVETATSSSEIATSTGETAVPPVQSGLTGTSTDEIDTSDWKVYKNEELKFEVAYPAFLQLSESKMENKQYSFSFNSFIDRNWDVQFSTTYIGDRELSINKKYEKFIKIFSPDHNFHESKIDNGYIFYSITWTKGGYSPGALVFSNDVILFASLEVYDEKDYNLTKYNKYIEDFLKILKTSKFSKN